MAVLMKYGFDEVTTSLHRRLSLRPGSRVMPTRVKRADTGRSRPQRVRLALEELGPTFIKLGQLLSTRPDLLPPEYIQELQLLQDHVAPVRFDPIRAEVQRELGGSLEDLFQRFDREPIAAASIAQVHQAITAEGDPVVVKVRRPRIVQTIRIECEILEELASLVKAAMPPDDPLDPVRMVREFTRAVTKEVDLVNERMNLQRFARNFAADPTVHIPDVFEAYSSAGVLTMEHVVGIKADDIEALTDAGLDPKLIAERGARFILRQVFDFGFFHADPHPGNLFVLPGNVLAPVDFGQVARLDESNRRLLGELIIAITERDAPRLTQALIRAEVVDERTDLRALTADLDEIVDQYASLPLKEVAVSPVIQRIFQVMRTHRVRPPAEFTLMLKSLMTIESLATHLHGEFQLVRFMRPYARRLMLERYAPQRLLRATQRAMRDMTDLAVTIPQQVTAILTNLKRGRLQVHIQHEHLEKLVHTLDRSSNRIAFGLIIAGTVVASSLLVTQKEGSVMGFIRFQTLGAAGYLAAGILGMWLLVSILRRRKV